MTDEDEQTSPQNLGPCPACGSDVHEPVGNWKVECDECGFTKSRAAWWVMQSFGDEGSSDS